MTNPNNLNELIELLKLYLRPIQTEVNNQLLASKIPIGLLIGVPRSGTTLFMQWIASLKTFSYPTNFLARFATSPYIGALIQEMIFNNKFDPLNEFNIKQGVWSFSSELGKSKGILEPNEFQHYFRNFIPKYFPEFLSSKEIEVIDFISLMNGLNSIQYVFNKPFVTKGMMLQYNISDLESKKLNFIYIYIRREPIYNMQSIYFARVKYYNDKDIWWSVKPNEFESLRKLDVFQQIAGQVYFTSESIERALEQIPNERKMIIDYNDFCINPKKYYKLLAEKYSNFGVELPITYDGSKFFEVSEQISISTSEKEKFTEAYNRFKLLGINN